MFKGFFNRMYNGNPNRPDIDPEDMPKNKFELFFTTLGIRFGDLIKLNLIFIVFLLPLVAWTVISFMALNAGMPTLPADGQISGDATAYLIDMLKTYLLLNLIFLPLAGPPLAGMTYVARNYARDEHAWLWSDFKEQMKKNWKQSMVMMLLLDVVLLVAVFTLQVYGVAMENQPWMWVMQMLFIIFIGMFVLSYMYVFPMLVTYKLKVGQILRNSLMLALGRLPFTLIFGFLAIFPLLLGLVLSFVTVYAFLGLVIYYLLFGFSLTAFIIGSYANATFDKLMRTDDEKPAEPQDMDREVKP